MALALTKRILNEASLREFEAAIEDPELRGARGRLRLKAVDFTGLALYDRLSAALQRLERLVAGAHEVGAERVGTGRIQRHEHDVPRR